MIREVRREYPMRLLYRVLEVSASGFQAWLVRKPSARARLRERLKVAAQDFRVERAAEAWTADITYVATEEGWL